jgi:hypothetical protein
MTAESMSLLNRHAYWSGDAAQPAILLKQDCGEKRNAAGSCKGESNG